MSYFNVLDTYVPNLRDKVQLSTGIRNASKNSGHAVDKILYDVIGMLHDCDDCDDGNVAAIIIDDLTGNRVGYDAYVYSDLKQKRDAADELLANPPKLNYSKCPRCGEISAIIGTAQTRSADEAATVFSQCYNYKCKAKVINASIL